MQIMDALALMEIKDRTWTIQACSAVTKEGTESFVIRILNFECRFAGRHGMAGEDDLGEEMTHRIYHVYFIQALHCICICIFVISIFSETIAQL
jgi:hypothetical protein